MNAEPGQLPKCSYIVASATVSVADDGFAVLYKDPGFRYFPTCHDKNDDKSYDVKCYLYDTKTSNYSTVTFQHLRNPTF